MCPFSRSCSENPNKPDVDYAAPTGGCDLIGSQDRDMATSPGSNGAPSTWMRRLS